MIETEHGVKLTSVERKRKRILLQFDEKAPPELARFVMKQLGDLHASYLTPRKSLSPGVFFRF